MSTKKTVTVLLTLALALSGLVSCTEKAKETETLGKSATEGESETVSKNLNMESHEVNSFEECTADVTLDEDDKSLIAWLIACEVGDRPYIAQVSFASVILNRIEEGGVMGSARGVVFESGDFISVTRGLVTGGVSEEQRSTDEYKTASRALEEALRFDPTGGALYFSFAEDGKKSFGEDKEIGGMVFGR